MKSKPSSTWCKTLFTPEGGKKNHCVIMTTFAPTFSHSLKHFSTIFGFHTAGKLLLAGKWAFSSAWQRGSKLLITGVCWSYILHCISVINTTRKFHMKQSKMTFLVMTIKVDASRKPLKETKLCTTLQHDLFCINKVNSCKITLLVWKKGYSVSPLLIEFLPSANLWKRKACGQLLFHSYYTAHTERG